MIMLRLPQSSDTNDDVVSAVHTGWESIRARRRFGGGVAVKESGVVCQRAKMKMKSETHETLARHVLITPMSSSASGTLRGNLSHINIAAPMELTHLRT